jgi:hypothetical protein
MDLHGLLQAQLYRFYLLGEDNVNRNGVETGNLNIVYSGILMISSAMQL